MPKRSDIHNELYRIYLINLHNQVLNLKNKIPCKHQVFQVFTGSRYSAINQNYGLA